MKDLHQIFSHLSLPYPAQKIYLSLLRNGQADARTLGHRTNIARTSIYDYLKPLRNHDLIMEKVIDGKTVFMAGDVRKISQLLTEKVEKIKKQQALLEKELPALLSLTQAVNVKIRFFEGIEGGKQMLKDLLWHDKITARLYWPYQAMQELLGKEFLDWFSQRRKRNRIKLKVIWACPAKPPVNEIFPNREPAVARRYWLRKKFPPMSYTIYENKVAFLSSRRETFGFIVESQEFTELMKMQHRLLWEKSRR